MHKKSLLRTNFDLQLAYDASVLHRVATVRSVEDVLRGHRCSVIFASISITSLLESASCLRVISSSEVDVEFQ